MASSRKACQHMLSVGLIGVTVMAYRVRAPWKQRFLARMGSMTGHALAFGNRRMYNPALKRLTFMAGETEVRRIMDKQFRPAAGVRCVAFKAFAFRHRPMHQCTLELVVAFIT